MKIIDRYILTELLRSFLIIIIAFILLFLIFDFSVNAGKFIRNEISFGQVVEYYLLTIHILISDGTPMVLLLALFWSMNRLSKDHEIVALQASGVSRFRVCIPLFIVALILAYIGFQINEQINAKYAKQMNRFMDAVKGDKNTGIFRKQHFFTDMNSSLLWFHEFDPETSIMKSPNWDFYGPEEEHKLSILANSGEYIEDSWWLYDLKITYIDGDKKVTDPQRFKRRRMYEWNFKPSELSRDGDYSELRLSRLRKRMKKYSEIQPEIAKEMQIELHNRFALPLMNVVAMLLALPFAFRLRATRSVIAGIGVSFLLVFAYYGLYTLCVIIGKHGMFIPYIIWVPNIFFGSVGAVLFKVLK